MSGGGPSNERRTKVPIPWAPFNQAGVFQFAVRLQHRVGVDGERSNDLFHCGELIPRLEQSRPQGMAHLMNQLHIGGHARLGVQTEVDHGPVVPAKGIYLLE